MRYFVLATDYDETLADHGRVTQEMREALESFVRTGRRVVLVTGRELPDLLSVCDCIDLFDYVVSDNGAVMYRPASKKTTLLAEPPPEQFYQELKARGITPLSRGDVVVATREPNQTAVLEVIREMGLELHVIFNKGAVMILPSHVNKAYGLKHALEKMCISQHNVAGVGDAENDHSFLSVCELSAAVANALPALLAKVDVRLKGSCGAGVRELMEIVTTDRVREAEMGGRRHHVILGDGEGVGAWGLSPRGGDVLIAGSPASGKSSAATVLIEGLTEQDYQFMIIDPEGDYESVPDLVSFGNSKQPPDLEEVLKFMEDPKSKAVLNLVGVKYDDRPKLLQAIIPRLQELYMRLGHPHWLIVDEAHHVFPAAQGKTPVTFGREMFRTMFITVKPKEVLGSILARVDTVIGAGDLAGTAFEEAAEVLAVLPPSVPISGVGRGSLLVWHVGEGTKPFALKVKETRSERKRHTRKYAQGELPGDRCFYFTGSGRRMNLKAQNLMIFLQIAEGIDEETWMHHLREHDYSSWFGSEIKDESLAEEAYRVESDDSISHKESVERICGAIRERFTLPAESVTNLRYR